MLMYTALFEAVDFSSDEEAKLIYSNKFLKDIFDKIILDGNKSSAEKENALKVCASISEYAGESILNVFDPAMDFM